jgi:hypothetical protein
MQLHAIVALNSLDDGAILWWFAKKKLKKYYEFVDLLND